MKFGSIGLSEAEGSILAHSVRLTKGRFNKGRVLSKDDVGSLRAEGIGEVVAARLEADDIPEDEAAEAIARAIAGDNVVTNAPFTGRCNLFAEGRGLVVFDPRRLDRLNLVHESITIATVPAYAIVAPREMLATVKIIPFAAPRGAVAECLKIAADGGPMIKVARFDAKKVGMVLTSTPGMKPSILDKTVEVTRHRVEELGGTLDAADILRCGHVESEVAEAARTLLTRDLDILLISGASAIVDRRDVIPAAVERIGGTVDHFGMPVDPGNLLLLAHKEDTAVLGLPGCARSPKMNGIDWVLERMFAGVPVRREDIMRMGNGGLLTEMPSRPAPREADKAAAAKTAARAPKIAALILAAGQSRRMGAVNKLLADIDGRPMVVNVADAVLRSKARPVVVVLGHEAARVRDALAGLDISLLIENPDYAAGLSSSLKRGLDALPDDVDGVVVCLGDMPAISSAQIDKLIAAYAPVEGRSICVPTFNGKRGNPVLWDRRFFRDMERISGDVGARHLIGEYEEAVCEVAIGTDAVLLDLDTPDALAAFKARGKPPA